MEIWWSVFGCLCVRVCLHVFFDLRDSTHANAWWKYDDGMCVCVCARMFVCACVCQWSLTSHAWWGFFGPIACVLMHNVFSRVFVRDGYMIFIMTIVQWVLLARHPGLNTLQLRRCASWCCRGRLVLRNGSGPTPHFQLAPLCCVHLHVPHVLLLEVRMQGHNRCHAPY